MGGFVCDPADYSDYRDSHSNWNDCQAEAAIKNVLLLLALSIPVIPLLLIWVLPELPADKTSV